MERTLAPEPLEEGSQEWFEARGLGRVESGTPSQLELAAAPAAAPSKRKSSAKGTQEVDTASTADAVPEPETNAENADENQAK